MSKNIAEWKYRHPSHGSCDSKDCPKHGLCHCTKECTAVTLITAKTDTNYNRTRGNPQVMVKGHGATKHQKPRCHPDRKHHARGWCKPCYSQQQDVQTKRSRRRAKEYVTSTPKYNPEHLKWEALRYKRCLELLFEYGYGKIDEVIQQLNRELPEEEVA